MQVAALKQPLLTPRISTAHLTHPRLPHPACPFQIRVELQVFAAHNVVSAAQYERLLRGLRYAQDRGTAAVCLWSKVGFSAGGVAAAAGSNAPLSCIPYAGHRLGRYA